VPASLDALAEHVPEVYVHVDLDALDPLVAPGIVDHPVPGGLSLADLEAALEGVRQRFRIRAATLATYNPARDEGERTLRVALRIIERVAAGR
jgi:arginase family enzyme